MVGPRGRISDWPRRFFDWLCAGRSDYRAFQRRKSETRHRSARTLCLWIWAGAAAVMLVCPAAGCVFGLLLAATFLSFAVLDQG
jgi:hypothetical protein